MSLISHNHQSSTVDVKRVSRRQMEGNRLLERRHSHLSSNPILYISSEPRNTSIKNAIHNNLNNVPKKAYSLNILKINDDHRSDHSKLTAVVRKSSVHVSKVSRTKTLNSENKSVIPMRTTVAAAHPFSTQSNDINRSNPNDQSSNNILVTKSNKHVQLLNKYIIDLSTVDSDDKRFSSKTSCKNTDSVLPLARTHHQHLFPFHTNLIRKDLEERKTKSRRKRRGCFGWCCCPCCPCCPCCSLYVFFTILLGAAIAAIFLSLFLKSKTVSTSTTIITAAITTTGLTTITTVMTTTGVSTTTTVATTGIFSTTDLSTTTDVLTTTTVPFLLPMTNKNDTVFGIWNTTAGGNSSPATPGSTTGHYYSSERPIDVFDSNFSTKYTNFGYCNSSILNYRYCGINTGLYIILGRGATVLLAFRFCTGNLYTSRDPLTATVEGSNQTSALTLGSSWTHMYNGSSGLYTGIARKTCGTIEYFVSNTIAYMSFRVLITSHRAFNEAVEYSELQLLG